MYNHMIKLKSLIKEVSFGKVTEPELIPDDEEELWRKVEQLKVNQIIQFATSTPTSLPLIAIYNKEGVIAARYLHPDMGPVERGDKWHKASEINLRILVTKVYEYGEDHDVYYYYIEVIP